MPDIDEAVPFFARLLGIEPTYADEGWAQFDFRGRRLALSGSHRISDAPALMIKVNGIEEARRELVEDGFEVGDIVVGSHEHERRCIVKGPGRWVVMLYDPSVLIDSDEP